MYEVSEHGLACKLSRPQSREEELDKLIHYIVVCEGFRRLQEHSEQVCIVDRALRLLDFQVLVAPLDEVKDEGANLRAVGFEGWAEGTA